jgi:hypothetical protein
VNGDFPRERTQLVRADRVDRDQGDDEPWERAVGAVDEPAQLVIAQASGQVVDLAEHDSAGGIAEDDPLLLEGGEDAAQAGPLRLRGGAGGLLDRGPGVGASVTSRRLVCRALHSRSVGKLV